MAFSHTVLGSLKQDCEMLIFLSLKNNSVTVGFNYLLGLISAITLQTLLMLSFSLLDYSLRIFHKHYQLFENNQ